MPYLIIRQSIKSMPYRAHRPLRRPHDGYHLESISSQSLFFARYELFKLVTHTSVMILPQVRLPCRTVQLDEAVLLKPQFHTYYCSKDPIKSIGVAD
jgi:hypothetical protein